MAPAHRVEGRRYRNDPLRGGAQHDGGTGADGENRLPGGGRRTERYGGREAGVGRADCYRRMGYLRRRRVSLRTFDHRRCRQFDRRMVRLARRNAREQYFPVRVGFEYARQHRRRGKRGTAVHLGQTVLCRRCRLHQLERKGVRTAAFALPLERHVFQNGGCGPRRFRIRQGMRFGKQLFPGRHLSLGDGSRCDGTFGRVVLSGYRGRCDQLSERPAGQ